MNTLTTTLTALWILVATPVLSQSSPVVVELFTSQGCSSCPPADNIMHKLAERDDVIAISLHVDYWDYIGWKDIFATAENTTRQKGYAHANGRKMIYTPQMIINGQEDVVGTKPMELMDLIRAHSVVASSVDLNVQRSGTSVQIKATSSAQNGPMQIYLVRFIPSAEVEITRGENEGRTLQYVNVVRTWNQLAEWDGAVPLDMQAEAPGDEPVVVLVQGEDYGPILAAAQLR